MYFDPRPKTRKEDLYNREKELGAIEKALSKKAPLIVITGVRRLGKTSLMLVTLGNKPKIIVDLRGVSPRSREGLYRRIEAAINDFLTKNKSVFESIKDKLKTVSGIQVLGSGISLSWAKKTTDLAHLFRILEEHNVVLAFDEVQSLRGPIGSEFTELIAHLYDYAELSTILTGSEVGLLYDFIGFENPKSPLYGRYFERIELDRFNKHQSIDFLKRGFRQYEIEVEDDVLEYAWEKLDGIVGWLVYFGIEGTKKQPTPELVDEVLNNAGLLAVEEFKNFLSRHVPAEKRHFLAMKAIANGENTWTRIKRFVESTEKRTISDSVIDRLIKNLTDASFIRKMEEGRNIYYEVADPVVKYAISRLNIWMGLQLDHG